MRMPTRRCLTLELNPSLCDKLRADSWFLKRLGEATPALYNKPYLAQYLVFFRLRLFSSVGCWTLCSSSLFNWLFFVQINKSSAITSVSQTPPRSEVLQQIPLPHWNRLVFCQRFQWSQDVTSKIFGVFEYAEAIWFFFFFLGKLLSSKENSENFTLAFLT